MRLAVGVVVTGLLGGATVVATLLLSGDGPRLASAGPTTSTAARPTATTATTAAPSTTSTTSITPPPSTTVTAPPVEALRPGDEGPEVLALQQRLDALGYWLGEPDGRYAQLTQQAVMAFQKTAGLGRDGIAGPQTLAALASATRTVPAVVTDGIEISLERQTLAIVQGGTVVHVLNTSTGRSGWRTPRGDFRITRQIDGLRRAPLGDLYRPKYFNGGIAVHGAASIPGHPASHGCARVSNAAIDMLWESGMAEIGTRVVVY